ncbi:MAG: universal stress protein [Dehalococcoidia bacterium]|nr:universal stress protein [Dehalococcoidia bacterium]
MELTKVLVPISGTIADDEAVRLAYTLARKPKARVYVAHIIEIERSLPLDAQVDSGLEKAEEVLTHAEDVAADAEYDIETDLLQAREAGPGIVDEAMERGVNLIVMGIGYKRHLGEFDVGETVAYVLKESPCQVLLYRGPFSESS